MSSYYMLECLSPPGESVRDIRAYPAIQGIDSWIVGSLFEQPPAEVIQLEWDPQTQGGTKALYSSNIPLMRRDLWGALRAAGVDNIDAYPAAIVDLATNDANREFVAFNVVGAVSSANLAESKWSDLSNMRRIDMDFDSLSIATETARGLLLFRLAECVSGIVVHDTVKQHVERHGFDLMFVPPEEWIG